MAIMTSVIGIILYNKQNLKNNTIFNKFIGALSSFIHTKINIHDPRDRENIMIKIIAKMPTIAAYA